MFGEPASQAVEIFVSKIKKKINWDTSYTCAFNIDFIYILTLLLFNYPFQYFLLSKVGETISDKVFF